MIRVLGSITDGFWEEVVIKCAIKYFSHYCEVNTQLFPFNYLFKIVFYFSSQQGYSTSNIE